ncbi:MAG: 4-(cytidine 5'-diphospho)-2-C-methyl-D-erythritol kinase [Bdellovibrionales bacterium]
MLYEFAPAKLNLYLHVTGRQANGFHNLDSLAVFAGVGDGIRIESAQLLSLIIEGPQAANLARESIESNLVYKAALALAKKLNLSPDITITLTKNLPVASGIGGGSSDAAATLRALARQWGLRPDDARLAEIAARLGQDVLVCLNAKTCMMTTEGTTPINPDYIPHTDIVLVNPNKALPTPAVFRDFREQNDAFSPHAPPVRKMSHATALAQSMSAQRNDLTAPAIRLMPEIGDMLKTIAETKNCLLSRMSGSGATCFGLYPDRSSAKQAASQLLQAHPGWWVVPTYLPAREDAMSPGISTETI